MKKIALIMSAAALLMITLFLLTGGGASEIPTVYSSKTGGYMACYQYLTRRGHPVQAFRGPPEALDGPALLIMAAPFTSLLTADEISRVTAFVQEGNTLVFLADPGGSFWTHRFLSVMANLSVQEIPLPLFEDYAEWKSYVLEGEEVKGVRGYLPGSKTLRQQHSRVEFDPPKRFTPVLMGVSGTTLGVEVSLGEGKMICLSNATMFSNYYFQREGNADFLETLLATHLPDRGVILFDEYHHGYAVSAGPGRFQAGFWFIVVHLTVLFALIVVTLRSSFRRPREPEGLSGYGFDEFIGSLADVHMIARHGGRVGPVLKRTLERLTGRAPDTRAFSGTSVLDIMQTIPFQEEKRGTKRHP